MRSTPLSRPAHRRRRGRTREDSTCFATPPGRRHGRRRRAPSGTPARLPAGQPGRQRPARKAVAVSPCANARRQSPRAAAAAEALPVPRSVAAAARTAAPAPPETAVCRPPPRPPDPAKTRQLCLRTPTLPRRAGEGGNVQSRRRRTAGGRPSARCRILSRAPPTSCPSAAPARAAGHRSGRRSRACQCHMPPGYTARIGTSAAQSTSPQPPRGNRYACSADLPSRRAGG
mmetsp:Transcript_36568/g.94554  ORF Transcript_36568/g.94554 Transcript_36568/m.94554 type:complete len:230 (-) Transcript_36568:877-1566(-)